MPIVFHPDLPVPSPAVAAGTYSLADVAANGVDSPAGGMYVCEVLGRKDGSPLTQPRLCYISIDTGDSGVAVPQNQFSHLPSYRAIATSSGPSITIHTIVRGKAPVADVQRIEAPRAAPKVQPQVNHQKEREPFSTSTFIG
eukprot:PhF_6_TR5815/c0_g1_i1/m.8546